MIAKKTVLHVITGLQDGGAESALYNLSLKSEEYMHVVVSMMNMGKYGPMLRKAGIDVYCLNMSQGKPTFLGFLYLWRIMRCVKPKVVQTWMYHADLIGGVAARLAGVGKVFWGIRHGNLTPGTVKDSTIKVANLCARLSTWVPTRIVSCSKQAMDAHTAIGYDKSRMMVIPNGYELSRYKPDMSARQRLQSEWCSSECIFLIGMVARFNEQKDHANLFSALQKLKQKGKAFHCALIGTRMDADNPELMLLLQKYDVVDVVSLLGRRDDVPLVMNALDLHVLSSLGEAFPNVLAEAMACGTPCVTTDVGDAAYIVGESGWVVPPQDSAALADALMQAMTIWERSPDVWVSLKDSSRNRIVKNFSIERMAGAYEAVWNS